MPLPRRLELAAAWATRQLPDRATEVTGALARALDLPEPVVPSKRPSPGACGTTPDKSD